VVVWIVSHYSLMVCRVLRLVGCHVKGFRKHFTSVRQHVERSPFRSVGSWKRTRANFASTIEPEELSWDGCEGSAKARHPERETIPLRRFVSKEEPRGCRIAGR
jgi:hypothetical protein